MSEADSTQANNEQRPPSVGISIENFDTASVKIRQLDAMINAIVGERFEGFQTLDSDEQHWYLMTISDLSLDIKKSICGKGRGVACHAPEVASHE